MSERTTLSECTMNGMKLSIAYLAANSSFLTAGCARKASGLFPFTICLLVIASLCFRVNVLGADSAALGDYLDRCAESLARLRVEGNYFSFTWIETESQFEVLFQGQKTFTRHFSKRSSRKRLVRGDEKDYLAVFQENSKFAHVNSMIQTGSVLPGEYAVAENDVSALFGFVTHVKEDQTYFDVIDVCKFFQSPDTKINQKKIDDVTVTSLKRDTKELSVEMLLVPEFGWSIKRIVVDYPEGDGNGITKRQFDASEFEKREGIFLPGKLTISRFHPERKFPDLSWHLTDFKTNQKGDLDFDKALSEVPDYAPVTVQDALHLSPTRTIESGKVIVKTDDVMMQIARGGHKFMPGPDSPRFWLMAIGIILILIGGGRLAYKYFRGEATL